MGANSNIEWTHHTFNPWIGCVKVSPACKNCYAETYDQRWNEGAHWGPNTPRRRTTKANWKKPIAWNKQCAAQGIRQRVFCASLADVFEDHPDLQPMREDLWKLIEATPHLDWLLLTKRPENVNTMFPPLLPDNVWIGTTVENQEQANKRIPELIKIPAAVRFLSCEPLLGPVDINAKTVFGNDVQRTQSFLNGSNPYIDWVIAGGESGPNARPSHLDWILSLRDQCMAAEIPFFFKQWGEWRPVKWGYHPAPGGMEKVGKKKAGNLLDGKPYLNIPTPEIREHA